jgi:uncharacterized membrane protein YdjX (TVP38/TMEM64 family)
MKQPTPPTSRNGTTITRRLLQLLSAAALIACIILAILAWRSGILRDGQALRALVERAGTAGAIVFVAIQILQVIVPILPGGVSCLAGVVLFGPVGGFIYNYIGLCAGSVLGFRIARVGGRRLLFHLFSAASIAKYDAWTQNKRTFPVLFGIAMLLPGLPDDLICYLAGTTAMKFSRFVAILLPCKILPILLYSLLSFLPFDIPLIT